MQEAICSKQLVDNNNKCAVVLACIAYHMHKQLGLSCRSHLGSESNGTTMWVEVYQAELPLLAGGRPVHPQTR